jgi:general secretion pathway protein I
VKRQRGFTLLEVMLALALLALAMGLLLAMLSGGLRQVAVAERETEAALHAQSILDSLGTLEPVVPGHKEGETADKRYRWTLDVEKAEDPAPLNPGTLAPASGLQGGPEIYRVALVVAWGDGERQKYQVTTLRTRNPDDVAGTAQ